MADEDADIELYLHGLTWTAHGRELTLIYNQTSPIVKNNIDLCILDCPPDKLSEAIQNPERYIALGELKGGIDPAGADEHSAAGGAGDGSWGSSGRIEGPREVDVERELGDA